MKKFVETAGLQNYLKRRAKLLVTIDKRHVNSLTKQLQHLMYMGTMSSIRLIWGQQARPVELSVLLHHLRHTQP